jgi:hypothetical protein
MPQTIEEKLYQLEKAHSRLFNMYQNLLGDFEKLKLNLTNIINDDSIKIKSLEQIVEELKSTQPKLPFVDGNTYQDVIEEIVDTNKINWNNKNCVQLEVKLKGREELYTVFVLEKNAPKVNNRIRFIYSSEDNKLSKLKVL